MRLNNRPVLPTLQSHIIAHIYYSLLSRNITTAGKSLLVLDLARAPVASSRNTDSRTNARSSPLHRHDALSPQEYWRIFDRNLISRKSRRAFIVDGRTH